MQRGHFDEAIRSWSQTLAINPAMVLVRANPAAALFRTGQAEQVRAVMRKAPGIQSFVSGRARFPRTNREVNTVARCGPIWPRTLSWLHPHWMAIEVTGPPAAAAGMRPIVSAPRRPRIVFRRFLTVRPHRVRKGALKSKSRICFRVARSARVIVLDGDVDRHDSVRDGLNRSSTVRSASTLRLPVC
jgi:hypothetical protein